MGQHADFFIEKCGKKAGFKLYRLCPIFSDKDIEDMPAVICHALCNFERIATKLFNEKYGTKIKVTTERLMPEGDDYCMLVF